MSIVKKEQLESTQAYTHKYNECPICYPEVRRCSVCGEDLCGYQDDLCDNCLLEQELENG